MPQALKPLSLIHIGSWENFPFPLLALWGNKNWLPSMKMKKLQLGSGVAVGKRTETERCSVRSVRFPFHSCALPISQSKSGTTVVEIA